MRGGRWRVALMAAAGLAAITPLPDTWVERWYAGGGYPRLQPIITSCTNAFPFALLDVLIVATAVWILWRLRVRLTSAGVTIVRRIVAFGVDAAALVAAVYLLFLALWGFNYRRPSADVRFEVDTATISEQRLRQGSLRAADAVNALYDPDRRVRSPEEERGALTAAFQRSIEELPLPMSWQPVPGRPKWSIVARVFPLGAVDGMMNPWGLEILINPEILAFERPFVVAHEWAHLAGHAAESEASFVAWLTCLAGDRALQYSGWLSIYLHLVRALPPNARDRALGRLAAGPRRDLDAIRVRLQHAHPWVQGAAWRAYDQYLRANRVESGIANYDAVTRLVLGSRYARPHLETP